MFAQPMSSDNRGLTRPRDDSSLPMACCGILESQDPLPRVESIDDAMNWFRDFIERYGGIDCCRRMFESVDGLTVSTAFSGIGAADVALDTILCGLNHFLGKKPVIHNLFAVEFLPHSQKRVVVAADKTGMPLRQTCGTSSTTP